MLRLEAFPCRALVLEKFGGHAQTYPSRPINADYSVAVGGSTRHSSCARIAKKLRDVGVSVWSDNSAGAGGLIGTPLRRRGAPDGLYTPLVSQTHDQPGCQEEQPSDTRSKDLTRRCLIGRSATLWLTRRQKLPVGGTASRVFTTKSEMVREEVA